MILVISEIKNYYKVTLVRKIEVLKYVTQRELMRLFEGDIKTDILNSTYVM